MQAVHVFNATSKAVPVRGLGTVAAGTAKSGYIPQAVFDDNFLAYKNNAAKMGIVVRDDASLYAPTGYQLVTGAASVLAATRTCVTQNGTGLAYALTLPAANSLSAGTILYFIAESGANDVNITRAGSDTIDGGTAALALNVTGTAARRLKTDGVSAWTSV